jgi:hypothetical protein
VFACSEPPVALGGGGYSDAPDDACGSVHELASGAAVDATPAACKPNVRGLGLPPVQGSGAVTRVITNGELWTPVVVGGNTIQLRAAQHSCAGTTCRTEPYGCLPLVVTETAELVDEEALALLPPFEIDLEESYEPPTRAVGLDVEIDVDLSTSGCQPEVLAEGCCFARAGMSPDHHVLHLWAVQTCGCRVEFRQACDFVCAGACVEPSTNEWHCGGCEQACIGSACVNGQCTGTLVAWYADDLTAHDDRILWTEHGDGIGRVHESRWDGRAYSDEVLFEAASVRRIAAASEASAWIYGVGEELRVHWRRGGSVEDTALVLDPDEFLGYLRLIPSHVVLMAGHPKQMLDRDPGNRASMRAGGLKTQRGGALHDYRWRIVAYAPDGSDVHPLDEHGFPLVWDYPPSVTTWQDSVVVLDTEGMLLWRPGLEDPLRVPLAEVILGGACATEEAVYVSNGSGLRRLDPATGTISVLDDALSHHLACNATHVVYVRADGIFRHDGMSAEQVVDRIEVLDLAATDSHVIVHSPDVELVAFALPSPPQKTRPHRKPGAPADRSPTG